MSATSEERTEVIEQLEKVRPTVPTVKFERHYLKGSPVVEILTFAADENIDLIVMASHGRTGIPRLLMGSIAEGVMRKAQCPVLVVKQPSGERKSRENSRDVENRSQAAAAVTNKRMRKQRVHSESPVLHGTHAISGNTIHFN